MNIDNLQLAHSSHKNVMHKRNINFKILAYDKYNSEVF